MRPADFGQMDIGCRAHGPLFNTLNLFSLSGLGDSTLTYADSDMFGVSKVVVDGLLVIPIVGTATTFLLRQYDPIANVHTTRRQIDFPATVILTPTYMPLDILINGPMSLFTTNAVGTFVNVFYRRFKH